MSLEGNTGLSHKLWDVSLLLYLFIKIFQHKYNHFFVLESKHELNEPFQDLESEYLFSDSESTSEQKMSLEFDPDPQHTENDAKQQTCFRKGIRTKNAT